MEKLSKNRGVISVFLLVIFVVTYVAMGMLVDAARYRIRYWLSSSSNRLSESSLTNSVVSESSSMESASNTLFRYFRQSFQRMDSISEV